MTEAHNLYYEVPGAGGDNDPYANSASALHAAREIAEHYPDAFVEVTRKSDHVVLFRHDGIDRAPDSNGLCDGFVAERSFNCPHCVEHFTA